VRFRRGGRVALTFDDSPSQWTDAIVEGIASHQNLRSGRTRRSVALAALASSSQAKRAEWVAR